MSKRKDSAYRSGRSPDWLKMKNSDAPAVRRAAHGDDQKTHFGPVADEPKLVDFRPKEAHGFKHHRPIITRMQASVAERPVALPRQV